MIENVKEAQAAIIESLRRHGTDICNPTSRLLSVEPGRRFVVRCDFDPIELKCPQGNKNLSSVTAKFFAKAEYANSSFRNLGLLRKAMAAEPDSEFRVPEPICFDEPNMLLLCRFLEGQIVDTKLPNDELGKVMFCAGRALKQLHHHEISGLRERSLSDHIGELISPDPMQIADEFPEFKEVIEKTLAEMQTVSKTRFDFEPVPLHRDFQLRQFVILGHRPKTTIAVLDWDDMAAGDPLFDVVYLKNYLLCHLGRARCEIMFNGFMDGYGRELLETRPAEHWQLYARFNFIRRACRRYRLKDTNWRHVMTQMLTELVQDH